MHFPFIKSHWILIDEGDVKRTKMEKSETGEYPINLFTIITFIDSYNFKNNGSYFGYGMSLHMVVKREELENFATALETEYKNFGPIKTR